MSLIINNLLTEADNQTHCPIRLGWLIGLFVVVLVILWQVWHGIALDVGKTAEGLGYYVGGGGVGIGSKSIMKADVKPH